MLRSSCHRGRVSAFATVLLLSLLVWSARADTGVSDSRVALPDGPGSVGGAGENLSASGNMGAMTHVVPLELPQGFAHATPSLALSYSSLNGSGELGIGWDLPVPYIERLTLRGVPRYGVADAFAADGSDELVRVSGSASLAVHRARFERDFVRYTWHAEAQGAAGYWEAEYPDGRRGFFGADSMGRPVRSARVVHRESGGIFRYLLVETLDRSGHRVRYHYTEQWGDYPLLSEVEYVFLRGQARYRVRLTYEGRKDVVSSALAGAELRLKGRLSGIEVLSGEATVRSYALKYEETQVGTSRLTAVEHLGADGTLSAARFSFTYSGSSQRGCDDCRRPFMVAMGTLKAGESGGVDLKRGLSTLIDINGDGLPDLLDTGLDGRHRFFLNTMASNGSQRFGAPQLSASTRGGSSFVLDAPGVQAVDVNGDGLTDLINAVSGQHLCNLAQGDWSDGDACGAVSLAADLSDDPSESGEADPRGMRFMDYDGDKRIDLLHTTAPDVTQVWRNTPDGFVLESVQAIGKVFDDGSTLQLADMNGDSLLDPVEVSASGLLWYRLNLGRGRWSEPVHQPLSDAPAALEDAQLADLNGDGLDDVVLVRANTVAFALNQAGRLLPFQVLRSDDVDGGLPSVSAATTVLLADMNGSGSTDVVWVESDGTVRVLELFALRPNLLTRIENGIGGVQTVEYGTSARQQAADKAAGLAVRHPLPQAMTLVTATERFATLTPDVRERVERRYHHGFYDGVEKRYRGFEQVEELIPGDPTQQAAVSIFDYDVGHVDPYHHGRLLREQHFSVEAERRKPTHRVRHSYDDCPLDGVPEEGLRWPVRYVCETLTETLLQEGRPEQEWVKLREERTYDGYGNETLAAEWGVVGMGSEGDLPCGVCDAPEGIASGPCGDQCRGDERFVESTFIAPGPATGHAWLLGRPSRITSYGDPQGPRTETLHYYDGDGDHGRPFVGLPTGQLTRGLLTRQCQRVTPEAAPNCTGQGWAQSMRVERDAHGNVVTELDPLGAPDDRSGHRRSLAYDAHGLRVTALDIFLSSDDGPYRLRREVRYDELFDQPASVTRWMLQDGPVRSEPAETLFAYDAFGRRTKVARPGDTLDAPTQEFAYNLSAPLSRILVRGRSQAGAAPDLQQVECVDGLGRAVQRRTRLSDSIYQVDGFSEANPQGLPVRTYQGYQGGADCDLSPPRGVAYRAHYYDGMGRILSVTEPDRKLFGKASVSRVEYAPLSILTFDAVDNDPDSAAFATPEHTMTDGLGHTTRLERVLESGGKVGVIHALWNSLGQLSGYRDAAGHHKRQAYDLLGRVTHVDDPNAGVTLLTYDAASNLTSRTDARGKTVDMEYDGANRILSRFDADDPEGTLVGWRYDFAEACDDCSHAEGQAVSSHYPLGEDSSRGSDEYGFDLRGQSTMHARTLAGHRFVTRTEYDHAGRVTRRLYPDGTTLRYAHDGASRPVAITDIIDGATFDARGLLTELRYANGVRLLQDHDVGQHLRSALTVGAGGRVLQGFGYQRDRVGNLVAIKDQSDPDPRKGQRPLSVIYRHDAWYRTTRADFANAQEVVELDFDLLDNITRKVSSLGEVSPAHVGVYELDAERPNAVARGGELDLTYDEAGQLTQRAGTQLQWDFMGRLQSSLAADGRKAEYVYTAGVERAIERHDGGVTYYIGPDFEVRDGIAVTYARMGSQRVARLSSAVLGTALLGDRNGDTRVDIGDAWLTHSEGGDAMHHLLGSARRLLVEVRAEARVFLHSDHLASLTLATAEDGSVRGERAFYPSGEVRLKQGYVDRYGFTGQREDPTTGLTHFAFRQLDTVMGRWASPDPLFAVATPALLRRQGEATTAYAYVAGGFSSSVDETGLARRAAGPAGSGTDGRARSSLMHLLEISSPLQVLSAGPEDSVRLLRATNMQQVAEYQARTIDPDAPPPTEVDVIRQVADEGVAADLVEFTTNPEIAHQFSNLPGSSMIAVSIKKKYLTGGSRTEAGWVASLAAPWSFELVPEGATIVSGCCRSSVSGAGRPPRPGGGRPPLPGGGRPPRPATGRPRSPGGG